MKRIRAVTLFSTLCLSGISGCTKPVPVEFGQVCQSENDKKYISVEGYLRTGVSVLCSTRNGTRTCGLELTDKPDGENKISVYIEEGTGKSQMEPLPKNYGKDSLKLHTSDGRVAGPQDRVRVIGKSSTATDATNASYTVCYIDVDKIEKP
jgi:hypothetical protein